MKVELNKAEIYGLLKSLSPPYELMNKYEESGYGHYIGGFNDEWCWSIDEEKLDDMSEEELYQEYLTLKEYWISKGY